MHWYFDVLTNYFGFEGRARRMEYWMFALITTLVSIALVIIDYNIGTYYEEEGVGVIYSIYSLCVLIPSLAVTVRRLHDTDRSGWWILICFVPLIGAIWLLVLLVLDGTPGDNRFGEDPKIEYYEDEMDYDD